MVLELVALVGGLVGGYYIRMYVEKSGRKEELQAVADKVTAKLPGVDKQG